MTAAQFDVGDRVTVRDLAAETGLRGHMRAPAYCRGHSGEVERLCGVFGNPETLAYGGDGTCPAAVPGRFRQTEVWPYYAGPADDTIEIEIYQHWLKAETP